MGLYIVIGGNAMSNHAGLEFLANVLIPPGFILESLDDIKENITLEESRLVTNIVMENYNCDEEGICRGTRNIAILTGRLNYSVTIGDLRPAESITNVVSTATTQFSGSGFLQINKTLGCSFNENAVSTNYVIDCRKGEEFVVDTRGERIYRISDSYEFMRILSDPNRSKTISIPYVIGIYSGLEKE